MVIHSSFTRNVWISEQNKAILILRSDLPVVPEESEREGDTRT